MLLNYEEEGSGKPIVLLHGMAASLRDWDAVVPSLQDKHRVIAIDLLGFGHSPMPKNVTYNVETHLASILETLEHLKVDEPFTLAGHSMGALLALKLAVAEPKKVKRLVLLAMPIYHSVDEARHTITGGQLTRKLAYYGPTSHLLCATWCKFLRPISSRAAHLYLKNQPDTVAQESVLHTWQSYNQSMQNIIEDQQVAQDLAKLKIPTLLINGDKEKTLILKNARELNGLPEDARYQEISGGHNLPIDNPALVAQKILSD